MDQNNIPMHFYYDFYFLYIKISPPKSVANLGVKVANFWLFYKGRRFLKELTEGHHQEWSLWLNLTQHGKSHQARTLEGLTD